MPVPRGGPPRGSAVLSCPPEADRGPAGAALVGKGLGGGGGRTDGQTDPLTRDRCGSLSPHAWESAAVVWSAPVVMFPESADPSSGFFWGGCCPASGTERRGSSSAKEEEEEASEWGRELAPGGGDLREWGQGPGSPRVGPWSARGERSRSGVRRPPVPSLPRALGSEGGAGDVSRFTPSADRDLFLPLRSGVALRFLQPLNLTNVACSVFLPKLPICVDFPPSQA